jgi:hypothetical protein
MSFRGWEVFDKLLSTHISHLSIFTHSRAAIRPCDSSMGMKGAFLLWEQGNRGDPCEFLGILLLTAAIQLLFTRTNELVRQTNRNAFWLLLGM